MIRFACSDGEVRVIGVLKQGDGQLEILEDLEEWSAFEEWLPDKLVGYHAYCSLDEYEKIRADKELMRRATDG